MIVYWLMFAYVGIVGSLSRTYVYENKIKTKYNSGVTLFFAVIIIAVPLFFLGMRTDFDDTRSYLISFERLSTDFNALMQKTEDRGFAFNIYQWVIKKFITEDGSKFLLLTAIIQCGAIIKTYYKYSANYAYSMMLFFLSTEFANLMGGIRQYMALSVILYFFDYILEKKTLKFLIVLAVACWIHITAIIWLPVFFVVQGEIFNVKVILAMLATIIIMLSLDSFVDFLGSALEGTNYEGATEQFKGDDGSSFMRTLIFAVPVGLSLWKKEEIKVLNNKILTILVNIATVNVLISLVANFTSGLLIGRLPMYFACLNYLLLALLFENVFDVEDRRVLKVVCLAFYALLGFYTMVSANWGYVSSVLGMEY